MRDLEIIDVAEAALAHIQPEQPRGARVSANQILQDLKRKNPFRYDQGDYTSIRNSLMKAFPIQKNRGKRKKVFRINQKTGYAALRSMGYNLRPIEHIRPI